MQFLNFKRDVIALFKTDRSRLAALRIVTIGWCVTTIGTAAVWAVARHWP
jgi:hypothetical protein